MSAYTKIPSDFFWGYLINIFHVTPFLNTPSAHRRRGFMTHVYEPIYRTDFTTNLYNIPDISASALCQTKICDNLLHFLQFFLRLDTNYYQLSFLSNNNLPRYLKSLALVSGCSKARNYVSYPYLSVLSLPPQPPSIRAPHTRYHMVKLLVKSFNVKSREISV